MYSHTRFRSFSLVAVFVGFSLAQTVSVFGQWSLLHRFKSPINSISFTDENTGFVGLGIVPGGAVVPMQIYRTTDGGTTWTECQVPTDNGSVTKVVMVSYYTGYAAVQPWPASSTAALWKTIDGGRTWKAESGTTLLGSDIGITSATMIMTDVFGPGLLSTDQGATWQQSALPDHHIGISYVDDLHGVMTSYKHAGAWSYTTNGGVTWANSDFADEGWGVWGRPGTSFFFAAPETSSDLVVANSPVLVSKDYGKSWQTVYTLPFRTAGSLIGAGDDLYVQACAIAQPRGYGVYRSSDDGKTWNAIGGPSALNDTRMFVVRSCGMNTIYAPDSIGGLWQFGTAASASYVSSTPDAPRTVGFGQVVPVSVTPILPANAGLPMSALNVTVEAEYQPSVLAPQVTLTSANTGWKVVGTNDRGNSVVVSFTSDSKTISSRSFTPGVLKFKTINFGSTAVRLKSLTIQTDQAPIAYCANQEGNSMAAITVAEISSVRSAEESSAIHRIDNRTYGFAVGAVQEPQLFDEAGRRSDDFKLADQRLTLTCNPGVYFLRYKAGARIATERIVVLP